MNDENDNSIQDQASQLSNQILTDPDFFFEDVLGRPLWQKQKDIVASVRDHTQTAVRSCNASGKTYTIAGLALWFLHAYQPSVVINTAPTHRQVENQFWREFRRAHARSKIKLGGKVLKTQYNIDEDWFAIGFSPRNSEDGMEAFQGWHGEHLLVLFDEASGIHPRVYEAMQGALAGGRTVRLCLTGNPTRNTGDFYEAFKDPLFNKIHISAFDIPNVKEGKMIIPGLATQSWIDAMKSKYGEDDDIYRVRVLGDFPRKDSTSFIHLDLVENAISADRKYYGEQEIIGLDPARYGNDPAAFVYRKGNWGRVLEEIEKSDLMSLAGKAKNYLKQFPKAKMHIDIIGLGVGVFDRLREQPDVSDRVFGVNSAMPAIDTERYLNLRAEGWGNAKDWLRDGILEPNEGWYQLAQPRYKFTSRGQYQLESKDDMKKRGVQSPNVGDAFVLTLQQPTEGGDAGIMFI